MRIFRCRQTAGFTFVRTEISTKRFFSNSDAGLVSGILALASDESKLNSYRANSRSAAEKFYSRKNTSRYLEAMREVGIF